MQVAPKKNGTTSSRYITGRNSSCAASQTTARALNGKVWAIRKLAGAVNANNTALTAKISVNRAFTRSCQMASSVPLAPKPSKAMLIAMKAKWCHCTMANSRTSRTSKANVAAEITASATSAIIGPRRV